jgi:hypothetical protein
MRRAVVTLRFSSCRNASYPEEPATAGAHVANLLAKLDVAYRREAAAFTVQHELV